MKALALGVLLLALPALADPPGDAPVWQPVPGGYFVNELASKNLDARLAAQHFEIVRLTTANESLRADIRALEHRPALTWKGVALLVGGGLVLGAGVTALALRR